MPTAKQILSNAKAAVLAVQPDIDKELSLDESLTVTRAAAASLDTVNPTIEVYPPKIPAK